MITLFFAINKLFSQPVSDTLLYNLLSRDTNTLLQQVIKEPAKYRCQVIYTRIDRNRNNVPSFTNYYFNYDPNVYFYPASTVKMPLAFLSLEKLNNMKIKGVDKYTSMQYDSSFTGQKTAIADSTAENGLPSVAHYIKKAFLISDNDAYNRMYQFVGQQTINRNLHAKGYPGVRITRQFMGFSEDQNRHTNPIRFIGTNHETIFTQPAAYNTDSLYFPQEVKIGKGYMNAKDSLVNEPINFTRHNNLSLKDLQQMLQSVLFPASVPPTQRFKLTKDDRTFLIRYMSQYPSETSYPKYDTSVYYDSYVKFYFRNASHQMPSHVRVFNKVGWAYGFLTDISYVADFQNRVEYMLTSTIYVNSDEIMNDNKYDYDTIGYPFMLQLGQCIYRHELTRERKYKPDLSTFEMKYESRPPGDMRPAIRDADN